MPNAAELDELDDDELESRLGEYRRELLNLRFQLATSQLDNSARVSVVRKDIARVLTLIREREIALAEGARSGEEGAEPTVASRPRRVRRTPVVREAATPDEEEATTVASAAVDEDEDAVDEVADEEHDADFDDEVDEQDEEDG